MENELVAICPTPNQMTKF